MSGHDVKAIFEVIKFAGDVAGFVGAIMMANGYLALKRWQIPRALASAMFGGEAGKDADALKPAMKEKVDRSLAGIGWIAFGFFLQLLPKMFDILWEFKVFPVSWTAG